MYSLHMSRIIGKLNSFIFLKVILRNSDSCYLIYLEFYKWLENRLYQLGFDRFAKWPWLIKMEHKPSQCFNTAETNWISLEYLHVRKAAPLPRLSSPPGVLSRVSVWLSFETFSMDERVFPWQTSLVFFQEQLLLNMRENRTEIITENIQSLKIALFPTAGLCFYKSRWRQESCVGHEALSALANHVPPSLRSPWSCWEAASHWYLGHLWTSPS